MDYTKYGYGDDLTSGLIDPSLQEENDDVDPGTEFIDPALKLDNPPYPMALYNGDNMLSNEAESGGGGLVDNEGLPITPGVQPMDSNYIPPFEGRGVTQSSSKPTTAKPKKATTGVAKPDFSPTGDSTPGTTTAEALKSDTTPTGPPKPAIVLTEFEEPDTNPTGGLIPKNKPAGAKKSDNSMSRRRMKAMTEDGKSVTLYKQHSWEGTARTKHTPLTPSGVEFKYEENTHISREPLRRGVPQPEKLKFYVQDTKGGMHERKYQKIDTMDWEDPALVSAANKWRSQIIRRLFRNDKQFKRDTCRVKWSEAEIDYLKQEILSRVAKTRRTLVVKDWEELAALQNSKFTGKITRAGTKLWGTGVSKSDQVIGERSLGAIQTIYNRLTDVKERVAEMIANPQGEVKDGDLNGEVKDGLTGLEV